MPDSDESLFPARSRNPSGIPGLQNPKSWEKENRSRVAIPNFVRILLHGAVAVFICAYRG